jgi:hypothetical protein
LVTGNIYRAGKQVDAFLRYDVRFESQEPHLQEDNDEEVPVSIVNDEEGRTTD